MVKKYFSNTAKIIILKQVDGFEHLNFGYCAALRLSWF